MIHVGRSNCLFPIKPSKIPQCINEISNNAPFCNRSVYTCVHFCYKMVHYGIWDSALWDLWGWSIPCLINCVMTRYYFTFTIYSQQMGDNGKIPQASFTQKGWIHVNTNSSKNRVVILKEKSTIRTIVCKIRLAARKIQRPHQDYTIQNITNLPLTRFHARKTFIACVTKNLLSPRATMK